MTTDEKLAAILAAIQTDPGNRGLARDPVDNLFTSCPGDFEAACRSIAEHPNPFIAIVTGFFIPTAVPPAFETDGPLGACFLIRALSNLGIACVAMTDNVFQSIRVGLLSQPDFQQVRFSSRSDLPFIVAIERSGPAADGKHYTMRGRDITEYLLASEWYSEMSRKNYWHRRWRKRNRHGENPA